MSMLTKLDDCLQQLGELHTKLIVLAGARGSGKTKLLHELGIKLGVEPLNVNLELGRGLSGISAAGRSFAAGQLLRDIAEKDGKEGNLLLLDNIELLFEQGLQINPLDLMKRLAHSKRVVAVWPGELRGNRLYYAEMTHPEYRDYDAEGVVVFEI
jgi:hypothetical protein